MPILLWVVVILVARALLITTISATSESQKESLRVRPPALLVVYEVGPEGQPEKCWVDVVSNVPTRFFGGNPEYPGDAPDWALVIPFESDQALADWVERNPRFQGLCRVLDLPVDLDGISLLSE